MRSCFQCTEFAAALYIGRPRTTGVGTGHVDAGEEESWESLIPREHGMS